MPVIFGCWNTQIQATTIRKLVHIVHSTVAISVAWTQCQRHVMHVVVVSQLRQCYSLNTSLFFHLALLGRKYKLSILFGQPLPNFFNFGTVWQAFLAMIIAFKKGSCKLQEVGHPPGRPGMCRRCDHKAWRQVPTSHVVRWNFHRKRHVYACHCSLLQGPYFLSLATSHSKSFLGDLKNPRNTCERVLAPFFQIFTWTLLGIFSVRPSAEALLKQQNTFGRIVMDTS